MLRCAKASSTWLITRQITGHARSNSSMSSAEVRRTFLDFFADSPVGFHTILPSASLIPFNDPSLNFVNSGMNPFKSIFLGHQKPKSSRVANVQKCIRLGGKHNDIAQVGLDGTHHTFFEMMGNWSFGDYFKWEAISMAWQLLTGPLGLSPDKLYVTYFAGDESLNLPPDLETRDHWRSLGLQENRILPFGMKDNFWEMAVTGPCGPCTEIHYDQNNKGPNFVNKGLPDVVEVWNIVFMQYNRLDDIVLQTLKTTHVDTGMGLERLVAIKQGSMSNYDSDLFAPLLNVISEQSGRDPYNQTFQGPDHIDTKYRILADHARMITACIGDGMFPEVKPKLRDVVRRALNICHKDFNCDYNLLVDLAKCTNEVFGDFYPEIGKNIQRVHPLLQFEAECLKQAEEKGRVILEKLKSSHPNANFVKSCDATRIYEALQFLQKHNYEKISDLSDDLGIKMYLTFGLSIDQLNILSEVLNVSFDEVEFERALTEVKRQSREGSKVKVEDISTMPKTNTSFVYSYQSPKPMSYTFPVVKASVQALQDENDIFVEELKEGMSGVIYLDKTSLYAEAGGQEGDKGEVISQEGAIFNVKDCQRVLDAPDIIAHIGAVDKGNFKLYNKVQARLNIAHRLNCMQNHTGAHLLNEALHAHLPFTYQQSSQIGPQSFKFEFAHFNAKIDADFITLIETRVQEAINDNQPIKRNVVEYESVAESKDMISLPGESYPSQISTIQLPNGVFEPCCGTHMLNTGDVQAFVVTEVKSGGTASKTFTCLTGSKAAVVRERGLKLIEEVAEINEQVRKLTDSSTVQEISRVIATIRNQKSVKMRGRKIYPFAVKEEMFVVLEDLLRNLIALERIASKPTLLGGLRQMIQDNQHQPCLVHYIELDQGAKFRLSKLIKLCQDKPFMLISQQQQESNTIFDVRACVPKEFVTDQFNAKTWLSSITKIIDDSDRVPVAPTGQDEKLVTRYSVEKGPVTKDNLDEAIKVAKKFAQEHIIS